MKRWHFLLGLVFLVTFLGGLIAFTPLSFVMRHSGAVQQGLAWQQARGTVWQGQVTGLSWRGTPLGAVNLASHPLRLVSGGPSHDVTWSGPQGQGQARIALRRTALKADGISLSVPLTGQIGTEPLFAGLGATVRLSNGSVRMTGTECETASGTVTSDVARLAAAGFGRDWPILTGPLTCENGQLHAVLTGAAADGTQIRLVADSLAGARAEVRGMDEDLEGVLLAAGFRDAGGALVYNRGIGPREME